MINAFFTLCEEGNGNIRYYAGGLLGFVAFGAVVVGVWIATGPY